MHSTANKAVSPRSNTTVSRVLALCFLAGAGHTAQAAVLKFDDLVMNVSGVLNLPTPYQGVLWGELGDPDLFAWGDISYAAANSYGNSYGSPSGDIAASNYSGPVIARMFNGAAFDFNGAFFSSYTAYDQLETTSATRLTLEGFLGATLVNSLTLDLNIGYDWVQAEFFGITSLRITGNNNNLVPDSATRWMIDDFTFNATPSRVPEPATMMLALPGLGLLGVVRRSHRS
jgi:hypothetical protein